MKTVVVSEPFEDGELRLGTPSWDEDQRSGARLAVKYARVDRSGKVSRIGEDSIEVAVAKIVFLIRNGALFPEEAGQLRGLLDQYYL